MIRGRAKKRSRARVDVYRCSGGTFVSCRHRSTVVKVPCPQHGSRSVFLDIDHDRLEEALRRDLERREAYMAVISELRGDPA